MWCCRGGGRLQRSSEIQGTTAERARSPSRSGVPDAESWGRPGLRATGGELLEEAGEVGRVQDGGGDAAVAVGGVVAAGELLEEAGEVAGVEDGGGGAVVAVGVAAGAVAHVASLLKAVEELGELGGAGVLGDGEEGVGGDGAVARVFEDGAEEPAETAGAVHGRDVDGDEAAGAEGLDLVEGADDGRAVDVVAVEGGEGGEGLLAGGGAGGGGGETEDVDAPDAQGVAAEVAVAEVGDEVLSLGEDGEGRVGGAGELVDVVGLGDLEGVLAGAIGGEAVQARQAGNGEEDGVTGVVVGGVLAEDADVVEIGPVVAVVDDGAGRGAGGAAHEGRGVDAVGEVEGIAEVEGRERVVGESDGGGGEGEGTDGGACEHEDLLWPRALGGARGVQVHASS